MCFRFLRQVLDETLRCSVFGMFAARFQDVDSKLGGYNIPKNVSSEELGTNLHGERSVKTYMRVWMGVWYSLFIINLAHYLSH